jgi:hypothetical protein
MNKVLLAALIILWQTQTFGQKLPCSNPAYRSFDFWIGNWEVFGKNGSKAGDSKISLILDSCVILEEWKGAGQQQGLTYTGKSYNTYNAGKKQWQQTWVDNTGNTTEYLKGKPVGDSIIFIADTVTGPRGRKYMSRLVFTKLNPQTVRQQGYNSTDWGTTWVSQYDLEYRKKVYDKNTIGKELIISLQQVYNNKWYDSLTTLFTNKAVIANQTSLVDGKTAVVNYFKTLSNKNAILKLNLENVQISNDKIFVKANANVNNKKTNWVLVLSNQIDNWLIEQLIVN